jgi:hypothetical protein
MALNEAEEASGAVEREGRALGLLLARETISKQWPFSAKSTPYAARAYCGRRSRSRTLGRLS